MRNKPWWIVLIGILHILEPVMSISINYFGFNNTPLDLINFAIRTDNYFIIFSKFLFPLAGISIIMYRKWSLPVFWLIELFVIVLNIKNIGIFFKYDYNLLAWFYINGTIFNIVVTSYLLLPSVRKSFFDSSLHWWKNKERFPMSVAGKTFFDGKEAELSIVNISESGLFFTSKVQIPLDVKLDLIFNYDELDLNLSGRCVYFNEARDGYGFELTMLTRKQKKSLRVLMKILNKLGLISERDMGSTWNDFKRWIKKLREPAK